MAGVSQWQGCGPLLPNPQLSHSLANIPLTPETQRDQERRIRREIANSNERRRMQSINAGFQSLKTLIPHTDGEKLSKVSGMAPGLQPCGSQVPVLRVGAFGVACQAGQGCKTNWECLPVLIQQWRSLPGRFLRWERLFVASLVSQSGVACAGVTRWPRCRGEGVEEVALSSRSGS